MRRDESDSWVANDLDTALLRTFIVLAETLSFTRTAEKVGRTQAAVSLQIRRLEELIGRPLFARDNRNVQLTHEGEQMLGYAKHIVSLCDSAIHRFREPEMKGEVRFGSPEDFATFYLAEVLAEFVSHHPRVLLNVHCDLTLRLVEGFESQAYDLIVIKQEPGHLYRGAETLWRERLVWVAGKRVLDEGDDFDLVRLQYGDADHPLPLVLSPPPCVYRKRALEVLDHAGIPWKIAYTSPSLAGATAAVQAGLGLTVLPRNMVPAALRALDTPAHWPDLREAEMCLVTQPAASPATRALASFVRERVGRMQGAHGPADR
jgi:DNA-binding transcriptional LysR family regulator